MIFPLKGNSKIRTSLENALREHRLPHAIIIDGDVGTGRHTLASFLSVSAVCGGENIPCGECEECRLAKSGNHPDITVIAPDDGKKNIAVAQIRQLKSDAYIKPHRANSRVFIIDYADTLNEQSQNALLKVLEEPPGNTVFILITESKASLLDTIISRCVVLTLNPPSLDEGSEYIASTTDFNKNDITFALESTHNNIGKALMLLQGDGDTKTSTAAKEFLRFIAIGNQWDALSLLYQFEKNRLEADRFFKDLKYLLCEEIKANPTGVKSVAFLKLYEQVSILEERLVTNINLSLLFADLTSQAKELLG